MRLWHKDLIGVLPRQQLISQWRECCCIAKNILINGTPNHILVNKIIDYPLNDFYSYGVLVYVSMRDRGYKCDFKKFSQYFKNENKKSINEEPFKNWHNNIYLRECLYNLEEKAMCNGIPYNEWMNVVNKYKIIYDLWEHENE